MRANSSMVLMVVMRGLYLSWIADEMGALGHSAVQK